MSKNTPTTPSVAKLQIGNQASISLDTMSQNGNQTIQIKITTKNDSLNKAINEIVDEVSNEIIASADNDGKDKSLNYHESQVELAKIHKDSFGDKVEGFIPIVLILAIFGYFVFRTYQKRKWREALLNKGFTLEEINRNESSNSGTSNLGEDNLVNYDKRKALKYAIVFTAIGLSILIGTIMDDFGYFIGSLFLLLGVGYWYYNERVK